MMDDIERMINEMEYLNNNTPDGKIIDADTILSDLMEECDTKVSGIAQEIFDIWKGAIQKTPVEQMFYVLTGMEFGEYLEKCQKEITRNSDGDTAA